MLLGITLLFIFLHQSPKTPKSQSLRRRFLAPDRFQTSSPGSRSQTSDLWQYLYSFLCLINCSLLRSVAIRLLSDKSLALLQSDRARMSCSTSVDGCLQLRLFATPVLCVTILDCPRLYQAVVCQVCRAIVRDFGGSVG